jgi:vitellogenic carboxypeptidase-like protein
MFTVCVHAQLKAKEWRQARTLSDRANEIIANASGTATLEDIRRNMGYDGNEGTDR